GLLASTLASAARARASADFWPGGFFSAMPVSVLACFRGRNVLASFAALGAGCATGASESCCGAGGDSLTAAGATPAAGPTSMVLSIGAETGAGENGRNPPKCASTKAQIAPARPAP